MIFSFKSSHLAISISVMTVAAGLAFGPLTTDKSLAQTVTLNGAGSTFVESFLRTLIRGAGNNVVLNYAAVGSRAGQTAFLTQTSPSVTPPLSSISFGISDSPLATPTPVVTGSPNRGPAVQVPLITGAITLSYNTRGLTLTNSRLRLSRRTYCGIFTGAITNWNNAAIRADNGGRRVASSLPIVVVVRSDSSVITDNFTRHLNTVCKGFTPSSFNWTLGSGGTVAWPSTFRAVAGDSGIVRRVASTPGAIGYADESTRRSTSLTSGTRPAAAVIANRAGNFVAPTAAATTAAFAGARDINTDARIFTLGGPSNNPTLLQNPTGSTAYPIVRVSYLLFYDVYSSNSVASTIRNSVTSAFSASADTIATNLGYAPLPESIQTAANAIVQTYVDTSIN